MKVRTRKIRILVADDHAVVRQGMRLIVSGTRDIEVAGEARDATEVLQLVREGSWDVVVLDLSMPGANGLEVLKEIKRLRPQLPVLILTMHAEDLFAIRAFRRGASGYLTKESAPTALVEAIRTVFSGRTYSSSGLAPRQDASAEEPAEPLHERLSDREYQILRLIASGKAVGEIAVQLNLSVKTVSTYRQRLLEKMELRTNAELTRYALDRGLV